MKHGIVIISGQFNYEECMHLGGVASGSFLLSGFLAEIYDEGPATGELVIAGFKCVWWPILHPYRKLLCYFEILIIAFC